MTTTQPTAHDQTMSDIAADKRELLASLPKHERELADVEALERDEQEQFRAIEQQHRERLAHFAEAKRRARANIGRCHAAGEWLRVNRPLLSGGVERLPTEARPTV
jgi:hypothetical protein